ncbi:MAG: type II toxin-antitoxin system HicB family antitoxin, partial [Nitrospinota bacterium]
MVSRKIKPSNEGLGMSDYHIDIFYSEEDRGYIPDSPDLTHCSAFANLPEEAIHKAIKAKEAWIESE